MADTHHAPRSPEIRARLTDPQTWLWLLGVNAWGTLLAVPALHLRLWASPILITLLFLPVFVLAVGIRKHSNLLLLLGFPVFLLVPIALQQRLAGANVYVSLTFVLTVLSLSAYLLVAAFATRFVGYKRQNVEIRRFPQTEAPLRWQRRLHILNGLSLGMTLLPIWLLVLADGKPRPSSGVAKPLSPMLVNAAAFALLLSAVLVFLLPIGYDFLQGEAMRVAPPRRKPWADSGFVGAIFLLLSAGYLLYRIYF